MNDSELRGSDAAFDLETGSYIVSEGLFNFLKSKVSGMMASSIEGKSGQKWYRINKVPVSSDPVNYLVARNIYANDNPPNTFSCESDGRSYFSDSFLDQTEKSGILGCDCFSVDSKNYLSHPNVELISSQLLGEILEAGFKGISEYHIPALSKSQLFQFFPEN